MLNPLRSEAATFRFVLWAVAIAIVALIVVEAIRAVSWQAGYGGIVHAASRRCCRAATRGSPQRAAACAVGRGRYLTVSVPSMPAWRWPGDGAEERVGAGA